MRQAKGNFLKFTLEQIGLVLGRAGSTFADGVKCTCYLADLKDFAGFNATYQDFSTTPVPPARTTVQAPLLGGIEVEIDAIAKIPLREM